MYIKKIEEVDWIKNKLHKNSNTLLKDLRNFMVLNFGFGDFIFKDSHGLEIVKATNIDENLLPSLLARATLIQLPDIWHSKTHRPYWSKSAKFRNDSLLSSVVY